MTQARVADDDGYEHPAERSYIRHMLEQALAEIEPIVSTGSDEADACVVAARDALRRSVSEISK